MEQWFVAPQMSSLAGQTVKRYGYDTQDSVDYSFNSLGFRSPEPSVKPRLVVVGNSISFGIGLPLQDTFGAILAQESNRVLDNRSVGCFFHENHDHLDNIQRLAQQRQDSVFLIQINNLDRRRQGSLVHSNNDPDWCVNRFLDFFNQTEEILKDYPRKYIYWDNVQYNLPAQILEKIVINNKFHLDTSLPNNSDTFGIKSHKAVAKVLQHYI